MRHTQKINKLIRFLIITMTITNLTLCPTLPVLAELDNSSISSPAYIRPTLNLAGGDNLITLKLRDIDVKTTMRALSRKANFNIVVDSSVNGKLNFDFENVSVNQAVESIIDTLDLVYAYKNDTLTLTTKDSEMAKTLNTELTTVVPVKYVNAKLVAQILNATLYHDDKDKDSKNKKAGSDYRSNSIIIKGNDNDIRIGKDLISKIDIPRESQTFKLNYADPIYVASVLSSTVFNDGIAPFNSTGKDVKTSELRVVKETFQEGSGSTEVQSGEERPTLAIRNKKLTDEKVNISPEGPIIVPDTRLNSITIMGTSDQLSLAAQIIPTLDKRLPQVAIEVALIEISDAGVREISSMLGSAMGQLQTGFNNKQVSSIPSNSNPAVSAQEDGILVSTIVDPVTGLITTTENTITKFFGIENNIIGIPTKTESRLGGIGSGLAFTTNYLGKNSPHKNSTDILSQLNFLVATKKAKVLSNPTVIAVHDTESVVSMVDEIVRSQTITRDATGFTQTQTEIGEAGITLNVIPKIGDDESITLRLRPSISFIKEVVQDPVTGGLTTLLTKRDMAFQELRLKHGSTLAIAGLINESSSETASKTPYLGDLPIVGALFRSSSKNKAHSELVLLVTPKILDDLGSPLHTGNNSLGQEKNLPLSDNSITSPNPEKLSVDTTPPSTSLKRKPSKQKHLALTQQKESQAPPIQSVPTQKIQNTLLTKENLPKKQITKKQILPKNQPTHHEDDYLNQLLDDLGLDKNSSSPQTTPYSEQDIDKMLSFD